MFTEKFHDVINHEGVVSIVSWGTEEPHVTNTWNSYLVLTEDERILIPAGGMHSTQADVSQNNKVKVTLGSREVEGYNNYQGTGFLLEGSARFLESGADFELMKEKFPFISRVLEITAVSSKQLL